MHSALVQQAVDQDVAQDLQPSTQVLFEHFRVIHRLFPVGGVSILTSDKHQPLLVRVPEYTSGSCLPLSIVQEQNVAELHRQIQRRPHEAYY